MVQEFKKCRKNAFKLSQTRRFLKASANIKGGDNMGINKNDVLTFMAAVASIINLLIQWMS